MTYGPIPRAASTNALCAAEGAGDGLLAERVSDGDGEGRAGGRVWDGDGVATRPRWVTAGSGVDGPAATSEFAHAAVHIATAERTKSPRTWIMQLTPVYLCQGASIAADRHTRITAR